MHFIKRKHKQIQSHYYFRYIVLKCSNNSQNTEYLIDNCVLLEGTGDLNHFSCVEKFNSSCPSEPYYDEEIYICE